MNRKKIMVIGASIITVILVIAAFIFWPRRLLPKSAMLQLDAVTIKIADGKCTGITGISVDDQKKVRMILQKYTCHLCADPQNGDEDWECTLSYFSQKKDRMDAWWLLDIYKDKAYRNYGNYYYVVNNSDGLRQELYEVLKPYVE
ncbi:MAG: hypothetical protein U0L24_07075 [Lachnospiraceae bacterium]|nr:hypothetical protein [Lachnospiraceae bacterium]